MALYMGIDESGNHVEVDKDKNRLPSLQVVVATLSHDLGDLQKVLQMSKPRKPKKIFPLLESVDYRHMVFSHRQRELFGGSNLRLMALCEMIKRTKGLDTVIVDGHIKKDSREKLEKMMFPTRLPAIEFIANADSHYTLVNQADAIAYSLFRHYRREESLDEKYIKGKIHVDVEWKYGQLIEENARFREEHQS